MYGLPESDGTLQLSKPAPSDATTIVIQESFIVALTCPAVEESLDIPIFVASVNKKFWIPYEWTLY
jgi:hypothetical protein